MPHLHSLIFSILHRPEWRKHFYAHALMLRWTTLMFPGLGIMGTRLSYSKRISASMGKTTKCDLRGYIARGNNQRRLLTSRLTQVVQTFAVRAPSSPHPRTTVAETNPPESTQFRPEHASILTYQPSVERPACLLEITSTYAASTGLYRATISVL